MGNRGWVFLALMVAAVTAVRTAPSAADQAGPQSAPAPARAAAGSTEQKREPSPEDNPFLLLCDHFHAPPSFVPADAPDTFISPACRGTAWSTPPRADLDFLIIAVPDPERTHLTLFFDRFVESIRRAAEDSGYASDLHWLPWRAPEDAAREQQETDPDKREKMRVDRAQRTRWPGLLLFRPATERIRKRLAVLLIGETPVAGVDRVQLTNALAYAKDRDDIPVVGPCFSGSYPSLREALAGHQNVKRVISGTATSLPRNAYPSLLHGDAFARHELMEFLRGREGSSVRVALMAESDTVYGQASAGADLGPDDNPAVCPDCEATLDPDHVLTVRFPREIARLRNAYEDGAPARGNSDARTAAASPGLALKLKDAYGGRDSVPAYSRQTPLAQESELNEIGEMLRREKVGIAGVIATDVLDALFVMRFLRIACPDVRFFVLDSDLLYVRPTNDISLTGTLSVTTYPLFSGVQQWSPLESPDEYRHRAVFDSAVGQAIYNAVRAMIDADPGAVLAGYNRPFWSGPAERPPLWLMVAGRTGYRPVALLGKPNEDDNVLPRAAIVQKAAASEAPPRLWKAVYLASLAGGALWIFWLIAAQWTRRRPWVDLRIHCGIAGCGDAEWSERALYAGAMTLSFFGIFLTMYLAPLKFTRMPDLRPGAWQYFFWIGAPIAVGLLLAGVAMMVLGLRRPSRAVWRTGPPALAIAIGALWFTFAVHGLLWNDTQLESLFFAVRSVDLLSGVSPVLPFLILLPAFAYFAWTAIQRVIDRSERRPYLGGEESRASIDGKTVADAMGWQEWWCRLETKTGSGFLPVVEPVDQAIRLKNRSTWLATSAIFAAAALVVSVLAGVYAHSVEPRRYDHLYAVTLGAAAGLVFLAWLQFRAIWKRLQAYLELLELHPLRTTFSLLPADRCWSPLWVRNTRKRNYRLTSRAIECLELIDAQDEAHAQRFAKPCQDVKDAEARVVLDAARGQMEDSRDSVATLAGLARIAGALEEQVLAPLWQRGAAETLPKSKNEPPASDLHNMVISEFVALRHVAYIRYAILHMRNLLSFVSAGFILIVLSVSSYPFLAQRMMGWTMGVIFVILGAGIAQVFAQMDRDATLSRLTNTEAGKVGGQFFLKLAAFAALPVMTLLSAYFPPIGRFLGSLAQPALDALH